MSRRASPFLALWSLSVAAAAGAFAVHIALRTEAIQLGYELGRAHARVARLREVKRILELELASYKTPERVDLVARTLFGMSEPSPDRLLPAGSRVVAEVDEDPNEAPEADGAEEKAP